MSQNGQRNYQPAGLLTYLTGEDAIAAGVPPLIGVVEGTGIGPDVIGAALQVLASVERVMGMRFEIQRWGRLARKLWLDRARGSRMVWRSSAPEFFEAAEQFCTDRKAGVTCMTCAGDLICSASLFPSGPGRNWRAPGS